MVQVEYFVLAIEGRACPDRLRSERCIDAVGSRNLSRCIKGHRMPQEFPSCGRGRYQRMFKHKTAIRLSGGS